jgi:hypothetical protein
MKLFADNLEEMMEIINKLEADDRIEQAPVFLKSIYPLDRGEIDTVLREWRKRRYKTILID